MISIARRKDSNSNIVPKAKLLMKYYCNITGSSKKYKYLVCVTRILITITIWMTACLQAVSYTRNGFTPDLNFYSSDWALVFCSAKTSINKATWHFWLLILPLWKSGLKSSWNLILIVVSNMTMMWGLSLIDTFIQLNLWKTDY